MRISLAAFVGLVVMSSFCFLHVAAADDKTFQGPDPATEKVIRVSLHRLEKMFGQRGFGFQDEQNLKEKLSKLRGLGFESADQIAKATIGQGFPLYIVRLDTLRKYNNGTDPWFLLAKTDASIYPLLVNLKVRSSATVTFQQEQKEKAKIPHVAELGNPDLIRLLTEARMELQKEGRCLLPSDCFAISIPALSLHLFGYRDEGAKEFKIVTLNHVRGHVKKEDFRAAKDVTEELSRESKNQQYDRPSHKPNPNKELRSLPEDRLRSFQ